MAVAWGFDEPTVWRALRQWIATHPTPAPRRGRRDRVVRGPDRRWVPTGPEAVWRVVTVPRWTSLWDPAWGWVMSRWIPQADRERDQWAVWQVILSPDPLSIGAWAWSGVPQKTRWGLVWEPAWGRDVPVVLSRRGGPDPIDGAPDPGDVCAWRAWLLDRQWVTAAEWETYTDPARIRSAAMWRLPVVW